MQRTIFTWSELISHASPESELHCGLPLTRLTLFARNVKKFQSKWTNSNKVNKLQPKKRPMFPPMSPETKIYIKKYFTVRCELQKFINKVLKNDSFPSLIVPTQNSLNKKLKHTTIQQLAHCGSNRSTFPHNHTCVTSLVLTFFSNL